MIFATGWRQDLSLLSDALRDEVKRDGRFHLYRHILPPTERRLGFVGYASSTNNMLTSEIAPHWLSECFLGNLGVPDRATMDDEIGERHDWVDDLFPDRSEGYYLGTYVPDYVDELVADMGLSTCRENRIRAKYFEPFTAERYDELGAERRRARKGEGEVMLSAAVGD